MLYDAFISYSHAADGKLAPALQAGLQRFAKPWWRRRALRVFRDQTGLSANPHLWASIEEALSESTWFVLLASPEGAASHWVNREVAWWLENRDASRLIPVVTDGALVWDEPRGRLDAERSTAIPIALRGAFAGEPRWVDLRWAHDEQLLDLRSTRFRDAVADIAAPVRGVAKDELESEEIRQHKRTVRTAWGAVMVISLLAVSALIAGVAAVGQTGRAERSAASERTQRLMAQADQLANGHRDVALLLALEAEDRSPNDGTDGKLLEVLAAAGPVDRIRPLPSNDQFPVLDASGRLWVVNGDSVLPFDPETGATGLPITGRPGQTVFRTAPLDAGHIAVSYDDGVVQVLDSSTGQAEVERALDSAPVSLRALDDATLVANPADHLHLTFFAASDLHEIADIAVTPEYDKSVVIDGAIITSTAGGDLISVTPSETKTVGTVGSRVTSLVGDAASRTVAATTADGVVHVWRQESGSVTVLGSIDASERLTAMAVAPGSDALYLGSDAGRIYRFGTHTPSETVVPFASLSTGIGRLWLSHDGEDLFAASSEDLYQLRTDGVQPLASRLRGSSPADAFAISGDLLAIGAQPGNLELRAMDDGALRSSIRVGTNAVIPSVEPIGDGFVASVVELPGVELATVRTVQRKIGADTATALTEAVVDGIQRSALVNIDRDGRQRWDIAMPHAVVATTALADGSHVAVLDAVGGLYLLDAATGTVQQRLENVVRAGYRLVRIGDDLFVGGQGEVMRRVRVNDGVLEPDPTTQIGTPWSANDASVVLSDTHSGIRVLAGGSLDSRYPPMPTTLSDLGAAMLANSATLAEIDTRGISLWDLTQARSIASVPIVDGEYLVAVRAAPDGGFVTLDIDGAVDHWTLDPAAVRLRACQIVARDLTASEWATYLPTTAPRSTCAAVPQAG